MLVTSVPSAFFRWISKPGPTLPIRSEGAALYAASASTRPHPKWLFGRVAIPPQPPLLFGTVTSGFAVLSRSSFVAGMSRTRPGYADQRRATTPTTCGPAIDVPWKFAYDVSLAFVDERVLTPGATTFGLIRFEPSTVTGPRLLKAARAFDVVMAPFENDAA